MAESINIKNTSSTTELGNPKKQTKKLTKKQILLICFLFAALAILASFPLISHKFPVTTDFLFHYQRLLGMVKSFSSGHWPIINTQFLNGLGYPVDLFYSNFFLLPIAFLGSHGVTLILSLKIFFMLVTFATFLSMFWSTNVVAKSPMVSFVAATLYGFSFFRLRDLYYRVGIGSITIFIFIPLIIAGYYQIFYKKDNKGWIALTLGMSGLILSHVITTFLVIIGLVVWTLAIWRRWDKKSLLQVLKAALFTTGLTAFFTLPMIEQMLSYDYFAKNHPVVFLETSTVSLFRFISDNFTIFPFSSYLISLPILLALLLGIFLIKSKKSNLRTLANVSLIIGFALLFLMLPIIPWKTIRTALPLLNSIQYVNRLIPLALPFLSFSAAAYVVLLANKFGKNWSKIIPTLVVLVVAGTSIPYLNAVQDLSFGKAPINPDSFKIGGGKEYLPADTKLKYLKSLDVTTVVAADNSSLTVNSFERKDTNLNVAGTSNTEQAITLPLLYYKGYTAKLNGKAIPISISDKHLIKVQVPKGTFKLTIRYSGTTVQHLAVWVSFLSLILFFAYLVLLHKQRK